VTGTDAQARGRARADEYLRLLTEDADAAEALLAALDDVRDLVFLGAGLTAVSRAGARGLPPAQRAQAAGRQVRLGQQRDRARGDLDALRGWLRRSGEEALLVRRLAEAAARLAG
jgi:hypothetical protein